MNITKLPLKPAQIAFLNDQNILFSCDMRSIGESADYEIAAMWKYENLLPWIIDKKYALVNSTSRKINYVKSNNLIEVSQGSDAKQSIYKRAGSLSLPQEIGGLWVATPHPDADKFAKQNNYKINYSYPSFVQRNNKFRQKELLEDRTPIWNKITSHNELNEVLAKKGFGYIKRKYGSGGFTVFNLETDKNSPKLKELFQKNSRDWFFEEKFDGLPHSIQCVKYKNSDDVIIFGFSEQIIESGKYFTGSKIKPLSELRKNCSVQLEEAILKISPILKNYEGFFGLDFIVGRNGKISILEANVRLTAATIPTLLTNLAGGIKSEFREDIKNIKKNAIILTIDEMNGTKDQLLFHPASGLLGKTLNFQLTKCSNLGKSLTEETVGDLKLIVDKHIGASVKLIHKNFWPYGWTICFIIEESHCIMSSWFLEKKILIDIFSCSTKINTNIIVRAFASYFNSKGVSDKIISNR